MAQIPHSPARVLPSTAGPVVVDPDAGLSRAASLPESAADLAAWFESVYVGAGGNAQQIRWADCRPNSVLVQWLNQRAHGAVRPGSRTCVVGCGLGDDCAELNNRGFDVTGIDISPTAIAWARQRFPEMSNAFIVADACRPPSRYTHRFDFVVEVFTLQSVPPAMRDSLAAGIGRMVGPRGILLVICRGCDDDTSADDASAPPGPPWPLTCRELTSLMDQAGLVPVGDVEKFCDPDEPGITRIRGLFVPR